jgi:hypothetical protein
MPAERHVHSRNSIQVLAPWSLRAAIKEASARELTSVSEYTRRALIEKLRAAGLDPRQFAPDPAGSAQPAMA